MKFKEALHMISGALDILYDENIENFDDIEQAESVLYHLIGILTANNIKTIEQLKKYFNGRE